MLSTQKRQIVALNADVVDYSRLMAEDFGATTEAMENCRHFVEREVAKTSGTLINFAGDNFMAAFEDAPSAISTAIAIAVNIESHNKDMPQSQQVRFRMGMDMGDVAISDDHYFGDVLNIAARVQAVAPPGGLCVSGQLYRALDEPALRFRPLGPKKLKNIPEEVEIYTFADLPFDDTSNMERETLSLEYPTLSVLPIHTEKVDSTVSVTAGIIRADLIHRISQVPQLNIIDAKTEAAKEQSKQVARYMLETGVHQVGGSVRVFATLFDLTTLNVVKSYKWTVETEKLLTLSERIADDVARSIEIELIVGEPAGLYLELDDPKAIEKVNLGWYYLRGDTHEGWLKALDLFGQVARSHPNLPYGYVLLAYGHLIGVTNEWAPDPGKALSVAREHARKGSNKGDPTGMAMAVEASILMIEGRHDEALAVIENLEIIRPTCDVTYGLEGSVRRYLGQWEKSIDLLDTAMRLTGLNKPWYPTVKSCSLFLGKKTEQAASVAEMVLEHQPNNMEALLVLAAAQVELGLDRRAKATKALIRKRFPAVNVEMWLNRNPYKKKELIEHWKQDLISAGIVETS